MFITVLLFFSLLCLLGIIIWNSFDNDVIPEHEKFGVVFSFLLYFWTGIVITSLLMMLLLIFKKFSIFSIFSLQILLIFVGISLKPKKFQLYFKNFYLHKKNWISNSTSKQFTLSIFLVIIFCAIIFTPPFESFLNGIDSSIYLNSSFYFYNNGKIHTDETLSTNMNQFQKDWFFLNRIEDREEWVRFPGGFIFTDYKCREYFPAFMHLMPLWGAIFIGLFGANSVVWMVVFFAILSIVTILVIGTFLDNISNGIAAAFLTACLGIEIFFARFSSSEIVAQYFFLIGLFFLLVFLKHNNKIAKHLAALSWSMMILSRIDALFLLVIALLLLWLVTPIFKLSYRHISFIKVFAFYTLPVIIYLHLFTYYQGLYLPFIQRSPLFSPLWILYIKNKEVVHLLLFLIVWVFLTLLLLHHFSGKFTNNIKNQNTVKNVNNKDVIKRKYALSSIIRFIFIIIFLFLIYDFVHNQRCDLQLTIHWFIWYFGKSALILIALILYFGMIKAIFNNEREILLLYILFLPVAGLYLYNPNVEAIQMWAMRRFVPQFIPLMMLLISTVLSKGIGRIKIKTITKSISFLIVIFLLSLSFLTYSKNIIRKPAYNNVLSQLTGLADFFPKDSIIFFERQLAGIHFHTSLNYIFHHKTFILQHDVNYLSEMESLLNKWLKNGKQIFLVTRKKQSTKVFSSLKLIKKGEMNFRLYELESSIFHPPKRVIPSDYPIIIYAVK